MQEQDEMTDEQIAALVKKTAEETAHAVVKQTFITLGIDLSDPLEVQADMQHLRSLRRAALKEHEAGKPPRSYRAIFQTLKELAALSESAPQ